jgi:ABC-type glutathione transport system ATPase component
VTLGVALGNFLAADDSPWELHDDHGPHLRAPPAASTTRSSGMVGGLTAGAVLTVLTFENRLWQLYRSRTSRSLGHTKVIQGISFDIKEGEFMVLVGLSGCGKSTLLRMLAGLEEITGGTIAIDGKVVNDIESRTATSRWCSRATRCTRT